MITNPDIIEAAARALQDSFGGVPLLHRRVASVVLAAVIPLILEQAAKVAEDHDVMADDTMGEQIAAAIRALKEQP